ncbi:protein kinase domain-containing protein [Desulfolithobacter sp.]
MSTLQIGDTLDTFAIDKIVHGGAMARIYRAVDLLTDQRVVLKIPLGDLFNHPMRFYHYQNEERIGRFLDHPNIVRFLYRKRSRPYIIQEYVEGQELRTLVGPGRTIPLERACSLVVQLARTLAYLHDQGICHLDLKPENIIITGQGTIRLLDFGLAIRKGMEDLLGEDFPVPHGTPYYIAPEQLQKRQYQEASDIYSLGVIFYEMLTGHLPFPRSRKTSITRWRLKVVPVPPRFHVPDLPPRLQEIILTCLERDMTARFQSGSELARALEQWQTAPVTRVGTKNRKPWQWLAFFLPSPPPLAQEDQTSLKDGAKKCCHVLGAVINDNASEPVAEEVRRLALLNQGQATLLFVIEDEGDDQLLKYRRQMEGDEFRQRLETFIQRFRHYNLDPTIRLVRGQVVETILEIGDKIQAELIVLGPPRRPLSLFRQSVVDAVTAGSRAQVLIAHPHDNDEAWKLVRHPPRDLTSRQVLVLELFLIDCWFDHVAWLGDLALALIRKTAPPPDPRAHHCCIQEWLEHLRSFSSWQKVAELLEPVHREMHAIGEDMRTCAGNDETLKSLYLHQALPCACRFREQLRQVSRLIRNLSGQRQLKHLSTLSATCCPVYATTMPMGGPLLQLHTIRKYMENRSGPSISTDSGKFT